MPSVDISPLNRLSPYISQVFMAKAVDQMSGILSYFMGREECKRDPAVFKSDAISI